MSGDSQNSSNNSVAIVAILVIAIGAFGGLYLYKDSGNTTVIEKEASQPAPAEEKDGFSFKYSEEEGVSAEVKETE